MAEVNEIVRVSVIFEGGQKAVEQIGALGTSTETLVDSFQSVGAAGRQASQGLVESFDEIADRLDQNITDPAKRASLTLLEVRQAQQQLNEQFERAQLPAQGQRIAQLRRQYDGLEEEIIKSANATDVFRSRLGGFGAQGSAGAASLIQLTRGIEDVRFGLFAAINNIEPFISSLQRMERVAAATGVSVRQQFLSSLTGPAGMLFIFQSILTLTTLLGPAIRDLFSDGADEAERLREVMGEALDTLIEFDRHSDVVFKISTDEGTLEKQLEVVRKAQTATQNEIDKLAVVAVGSVAAVAQQVAGQWTLTLDVLSDKEKEQRDNAKNRLDLLTQLQEKIQGELDLTKALTAAEKELKELGIGTPTDPDAEKRATDLARLRERLARELAATEKEITEDQVARDIRGVEEVFRRRLDLARQLGDTQAAEQFEVALVTRIFQIRKDAAEKQRKEDAEAAEREARQREKLERELQAARGSAIDDEFKQRIAKEEELFRRRIQLAQELQDQSAVLELERLLEARRFDIFQEFQEKRLAAEEQTRKKLARIQEQLARDAQREFEKTVREVQRFTDVFVNSLLDAARARPGISEEEIRLQRDLFQEQENELRESLRRRLVDQEEFSLRLREINQERADFEQEVEEKNRSFIERTAREIGNFLIQEAARRVSAFIAQQIAQALFARAQLAAAVATTNAAMASIGAVAGPAASAVSIATFGGAAVAGGAAMTSTLLSIQALITALQAAGAARGFAEGGFTGNRDRRSPAGIVHGGEFVFEEPLVSRDLSAYRKLHRYLRAGGSLRDLLNMYGLRGFQLGGFVPQLAPSSSFQGGPIDTSRDLDRLTSRFDEMTRLMRGMTRSIDQLADRPINVNIDSRRSRAITEVATVDQVDLVPRDLTS